MNIRRKRTRYQAESIRAPVSLVYLNTQKKSRMARPPTHLESHFYLKGYYMVKLQWHDPSYWAQTNSHNPQFLAIDHTHSGDHVYGIFLDNSFFIPTQLNCQSAMKGWALRRFPRVWWPGWCTRVEPVPCPAWEGVRERSCWRHREGSRRIKLETTQRLCSDKGKDG